MSGHTSSNAQRQQNSSPLPGYNQARVGIGVFVLRPSPSDLNEVEFIIGKRLGSHGSGTWALPGGHLEFGESFEECAARELREETGLEINDMAFLTATNDIMHDAGKHYVTVFISAGRVDSTAEPELCEPEKCQEWKWIRWSELVRWAKSEMSIVEGKKTGTQAGIVSGAQEMLDGKLFSPLLALVQQRPGVVPKLPL